MEKMNLKELKAYAKQKGIKGYSKLKKDELREFIQSQSNKQIDRIKLLSSTPLETIYDDITYNYIMFSGRPYGDSRREHEREKDEPNYLMKLREYDEILKMVEGKKYKSDKSLGRVITKQRKEKAKSRIRREGWTMNNPTSSVERFMIYRKPKKFKKFLMDDSDSD